MIILHANISLSAVRRNQLRNSFHSHRHLKAKASPQRNVIRTLASSIFSICSSFTINEILIKIILTLLTGLLLSNSVLFYKLWVLEERLIEEPVDKDYFELFNDHGVGSKSEEILVNPGSGKANNIPAKDQPSSQSDNSMKQTTDWLKLLHRQEIAHQLELEKWHAIIGAATDLLRKVCTFYNASFRVTFFIKPLKITEVLIS